ncbi:hypothetical protein C8F01DRAFT_128332 [Mycena amicta]|nr:hypothetical protein C8F01DRAFT_128332 [Mycena amicta]
MRPARVALRKAFAGLNKFPNLEHLHLDFHGTWQEEESYEIPQNPTHYLLLQIDLFEALASSPPPTSLASLTLHNLLAVPNDVFTRADFHRVFQPLKSLELDVLSDVDSEGSYFQDPLLDFWETSMAHIVRSATNVTSLTLKSDQDTGASPALSFEGTFLPNLTSLSLTKFAFEPSSPASDVALFIVKHKATLRRLELHDCTIDGGEDEVYLRPWHTILRLFEEELIPLKEFILKNTTVDKGASPLAYTRLDPGWGYHIFSEFSGADQDAAALESLLAVVESRNQQS